MRTKTGALLAASVAGGALCARRAPSRRSTRSASSSGSPSRSRTTSSTSPPTPQTLGKRAGKDAAAGKSTLPAIVGIEEARRRAEALLDEALAALAPLGDRAEPLRAVARFVLSRKK